MINEILKIINAWDPVNIKNITPMDEYYNEAKDIADFLKNNESVNENELAFQINKIFIKWFGKDVCSLKNDELRSVANKILSVYLMYNKK